MSKPLTIRYFIAMMALSAAFVSVASFAEEQQELKKRLDDSGQKSTLKSQSAQQQSLIDIYQLALTKDLVLASALSSNKAAQEIIAQSKALYRPTVSFKAGASASETDIENIGVNIFRDGRHTFESYDYGIGVRQPIYRKENLIEMDQAKTQVSQADKQYYLAQQNLIVRVTQSYFEVLLAQDKINLTRAQKKAILSQLQQAKASFEVGIATITDVNEAQARHDLVQAEEIAAINAHQLAMRAIQLITGQIPEKLATVKADLQVIALDQTMGGWQQIAAQNNLAIQIQEDRLKHAQQAVALAKAGHLPTLDAIASYRYDYANGGANGFGNRLENSTIGLALEIPLYQGGAINSRSRQAVYDKQKAQDDLSLQMRQTDLDTQRAYLNLNTSIAQITAFEQALSSSQSQLDATKLGYEVGVRTSVDVLNAQQQLYAAKRDLLQARYAYLINTVRLKYATGLLAEADLQEINQQLITIGIN